MHTIGLYNILRGSNKLLSTQGKAKLVIKA